MTSLITILCVIIAVTIVMGYTMHCDMKDARENGHTIHPLFTIKRNNK